MYQKKNMEKYVSGGSTGILLARNTYSYFSLA